MRKIIIIILLILLVNYLAFSLEKSDDDKILDMSTDDIYTSDNSNIKEDNKKKKAQDYISLELSISNKNTFDYNFINNSTINEDNRFDINTYAYILYVDIMASLNFSSIFKIYIDNSFRFIRDGNELYNLIDEDHEDDFENRLANRIRELYLLWNIPSYYPIKITFGRVFFNPGNSYTFNVFNDLAYEKRRVTGLLDSDEIGVNMLKLSMYINIFSFDFIYSPGYFESNDTTEYFNIPEENKFLLKLNFTLPYIDFGFNGYIDTSLAWSVGTTFCINITDQLIFYSDLALKGNEEIDRLDKQDEILYGDMHEYKWEEYRKLGFSGVVFGMNFTPGSILNIIVEIYFNSNGLFPGEQKIFFDNLNDVNSYHKDPETLSIPSGLPTYVNNNLKSIKKEQKEGYSDYYYGVLGDSMNAYNAFDYGILFLFIKISKDNIGLTGLDLSLSSFIYILDGSGMLIPSIRYNFLKYFALEISANIFLGYKGSVFGEMPYIAELKFLLEIKL